MSLPPLNLKLSNSRALETAPADIKKSKANCNYTVVVAALAVFAGFYYFVRPHLMWYHGDLAYMQNCIRCKNEPQNSLMPGCKNNVYCMNEDPGFKKFNDFYAPLLACRNDISKFHGNEWEARLSIASSKEHMENRIEEYQASTSRVKQWFDTFYFNHFV